jgi:hypothetical protein
VAAVVLVLVVASVLALVSRALVIVRYFSNSVRGYG